jgi:hypothetical protein
VYPGVCFAEAKLNCAFDVAAAARDVRGLVLALPDLRKERVEEVREIARTELGFEISWVNAAPVFGAVPALLVSLLGCAFAVQHVVLAPLLGISEHFVRLLEFLELLLGGLLIVRICVRMPLTRELAIG